ncbi:Ku protein [Streptomyces sp. NPDC049597]|uniref:Ku protein n=1 Tax=Streptomyces sp. NPDC049597 TaxID=3155276 RepID=UPI00342F18E6
MTDGSRVEYRRFCRAEGREIPYEEVGRGFAMPDGRTVPTDEDLEHLPLPTKHTIEVLGFVPGQDIDPISYAKPYWARPDGPGADRRTPCSSRHSPAPGTWPWPRSPSEAASASPC